MWTYYVRRAGHKYALLFILRLFPVEDLLYVGHRENKLAEKKKLH